MLINVDQREARAQPLVILLQAAIAHLHEAEDALQDAEGPLHFRSYSRLGPVLALLHFIHTSLGFRAPVGHVLRPRSGFVNRLGLSLIAAVAPHFRLSAVQ